MRCTGESQDRPRRSSDNRASLAPIQASKARSRSSWAWSTAWAKSARKGQSSWAAWLGVAARRSAT